MKNISFTLDEKEFRFMLDKDFLLTKSDITAKIIQLLEHTQRRLQDTIGEGKYILPSGTDAGKGKISRGEYYKKLPWIILDYPKKFSNECIFTFRTLFRWGNEFSCTLHLQHQPFEEKKEKLLSNLQNLKGKSVYICVNSSPWEYHYEKSNYTDLDSLTYEEAAKIILEKKFVKLSRKIPLEDYETLGEFSEETFRLFMNATL